MWSKCSKNFNFRKHLNIIIWKYFLRTFERAAGSFEVIFEVIMLNFQILRKIRSCARLYTYPILPTGGALFVNPNTVETEGLKPISRPKIPSMDFVSNKRHSPFILKKEKTSFVKFPWSVNLSFKIQLGSSVTPVFFCFFFLVVCLCVSKKKSWINFVNRFCKIWFRSVNGKFSPKRITFIRLEIWHLLSQHWTMWKTLERFQNPLFRAPKEVFIWIWTSDCAGS